MNWVYAAAASVALVFGVTFFMNENDSAEKASQNTVIAANTVEDVIPSADLTDETAIVNQTVGENPQDNLTLQKPSHLTIEQPAKKMAQNRAEKKVMQQTKPAPKNVEKEMDQVLASFPVAELADLGRNAEQDVYLDLYN